MKNINVFAAELPSLNVLVEKINQADGITFSPLTESQWSTIGLNPESKLTNLENGYRIDFIFSSKDIPKAQIKEESELRLLALQRELSKEEIADMYEQVAAEYCERVIANTIKFSAFYHEKRQCLIFDCKEFLSKRGLSLIINAIGSVETKTLHCSGISNSLTTNMLDCIKNPDEHQHEINFAGFEAGNLLVMANKDNDVVRFKGDYPIEQVRELIENGYEIKEINLSKDSMSFTINEKFKIKNVKSLFDIDEIDFDSEEDRKLHNQYLELEIMTNHCEALRSYFDKHDEI